MLPFVRGFTDSAISLATPIFSTTTYCSVVSTIVSTVGSSCPGRTKKRVPSSRSRSYASRGSSMDGRGTIGVQALTDVLVGPQLVCESVRELRDALVDLTKEGLVEGCAFTPRIEVVHEMLLPEPGTSTFTGEEASDTRHKRVLDSEGHEGNRLGTRDDTKLLESWRLRS